MSKKVEKLAMNSKSYMHPWNPILEKIKQDFIQEKLEEKLHIDSCSKCRYKSLDAKIGVKQWQYK